MGGMIHVVYKRKTLTPEQESEICQKCQFCCRWIGFTAPIGAQQQGYHDFITRWGIPLDIVGTNVHMWVQLPCQHIRDKQGCTIYATRPETCRKFKGGDADPAMIPYCGWYEPIPEDEKFRALRTIEWPEVPKESVT